MIKEASQLVEPPPKFPGLLPQKLRSAHSDTEHRGKKGGIRLAIVGGTARSSRSELLVHVLSVLINDISSPLFIFSFSSKVGRFLLPRSMNIHILLSLQLF